MKMDAELAQDNVIDNVWCSSVTLPTNLIMALRAYWTREVLVRNATRSLARLNDSTLLNLGVSHREMIEFTVRYCLRC
jgi:hypothetical protein